LAAGCALPWISTIVSPVVCGCARGIQRRKFGFLFFVN
jgi:hypothetical protein